MVSQYRMEMALKRINWMGNREIVVSSILYREMQAES